MSISEKFIVNYRRGGDSATGRKSKVKSQKSKVKSHLRDSATESKVLIGKGFMIFGLVTYFRPPALVPTKLKKFSA